MAQTARPQGDRPPAGRAGKLRSRIGDRSTRAANVKVDEPAGHNLRDAPESIQELLQKHGGASIVLCDAGIPPLRRAETLALEEWASLVNAMV